MSGESGGLFRLVETALRRRRLVLVAYSIAAAAAAPGVLLLRNDNSPQVFYPQAAAAQENYQLFQGSFGSDSAVRLVVAGPGVWTREGLTWLAEIERRTGSLAGVLGSAGLVTHHSSRFPDWPPDPETFRNLVLQDPLDTHAGWVSRDGSTVTVLLALAELPPVQLETLLRQLEELTASAPPGTESWLAGLPLFQRALDEALWHFLSRYFPVLIVLVVGLLLLVFRKTAHLAPPLMLVTVCEVTTLGAMGYSGQSLNMVLILLIPLLLVIALATAIHVLLRFRHHRQQGEAREAAVEETFREKTWPVVWTGITTAGAFGSLVASPVPPVRALGIWAALGIGLVTVASLTFYPALLALGQSAPEPLSTTPFERWGRLVGRRMAGWAVRRRASIFVGSGVLALLWLAGATSLQVNTDLRGYFPIQQLDQWQITRLERVGIGVVAGEVIMTAVEPRATLFDHPEGVQRLGALATELRSQSGILSVVSVAEVVDSLRQELEFTAGRDDPTQNRLRGNPQIARLLPFLVTRDGRKARVSLLVPMGSAERLLPVFDAARSVAERRFPETEAHITGIYPLVLAAQRDTLQTMIESFSVALLLVAGIFCLLLGNARIGLKALLPNLWPVLFVLGAMGWLEVALDSTTVTIAAVVLGLVVDDTLHTLGLFRRLSISGDSETAAIATLEATGGAHILSSLLLAGGFGVCALSEFLPVARFGAFSAMTILFALAGDLILMPALLAENRRKSSLERPR